MNSNIIPVINIYITINNPFLQSTSTLQVLLVQTIQDINGALQAQNIIE